MKILEKADISGKTKFSDKSIAIVSVIITALLLLAAVVPLIYLAKFSHPCADDYTYGSYTHEIWTSTHNIFKTIKEAFFQVRLSYYQWQGTHSSIFLMALSPAVFEDTLPYGLTAVIMIGMTVLSVIIFMQALFAKLLGAQKWQTFCVSFITIFWMLESAYSPVNAFYWFNGAVHYTFMHGCMLLMCACCIFYYAENKKRKNSDSIVKSDSIKKGNSIANDVPTEKGCFGRKTICIVLAAFLAFICGGTNYTTALLSGILLVMFLVFSILEFKKPTLLIPLVSYAVSFYISVTAPGNSLREQSFEKMGPVRAILSSYRQAFTDDLRWLDFQTVIILLMLIPLLYSMAGKADIKTYYMGKPGQEKSGRGNSGSGASKNPVIYLVFPVSVILSFSLHAAMNVPLFYAMGSAGVDRQENICKMWFQLMMVVNLYLFMVLLRTIFLKINVSKSDSSKTAAWFEKTAVWFEKTAVWFEKTAVGDKTQIDNAAPNGNKNLKKVFLICLYSAVLLAVMFLHIKKSGMTLYQYSSYVAYVEIRSGEAENFDEEFETRREILENSSEGDTVILDGYSVKPYLLYFDDITENASNWKNIAVAGWYHINSVSKSPD